MRRTVDVDGAVWDVYPSGRVSFYRQDEFTVVFERGAGPDLQRRVTKYAPLGARRPDQSLAELSDAQLRQLFRESQPSWTSPAAAYHRKG